MKKHEEPKHEKPTRPDPRPEATRMATKIDHDTGEVTRAGIEPVDGSAIVASMATITPAPKRFDADGRELDVNGMRLDMPSEKA